MTWSRGRDGKPAHRRKRPTFICSFRSGQMSLWPYRILQGNLLASLSRCGLSKLDEAIAVYKARTGTSVSTDDGSRMVEQLGRDPPLIDLHGSRKID